MNDNALYWVWIQQALGCASRKPVKIASCFGSARAFYEAGEAEWRLSGLLTSREIGHLRETKLTEAETIVEQCGRLGQKLLTLEDEGYPVRLREIYDPPAVLYYKGIWPDFSKRTCIAIVGTRQATPYGKNMAFQFGLELARAGVTVVSGGALGIDAISHKGALQGGGLTIAVLGCGLNAPYLTENADLRYVIAQTGALVTEYPPDTSAAAFHFPKRNRIISGLCQGTLVIEAGRKSGSLITADLAAEQGRDVFALPGDVRSVFSSGTNELIKNGAKMVTCARDILEEYGEVSPQEAQEPRLSGESWRGSPLIPEQPDPKTPSILSHKPGGGVQAIEKNETVFPEGEPVLPDLLDALSPDGKRLYDALGQESQPMERLMEKTKLPMGRLLCAVTELELSGLLLAEPGRSYRKTR